MSPAAFQLDRNTKDLFHKNAFRLTSSTFFVNQIAGGDQFLSLVIPALLAQGYEPWRCNW
jgi:hypothetical protein